MKKKCLASSIDQLSTGTHAVMSMSVASLNQGIYKNTNQGNLSLECTLQ